MHDDGRRVGRVDDRQRGERCTLWRRECGVAHGIVGGLDVCSGDRRAVGEPEIRTQVEDDRAPILHGPAARELRNAPAGRISSGEGDVKQVAQPGAVGVGLEPGVEAPRIAVEGDDQPAGRGRHLAAAGGERAEQRQNNAGRRRRFDSVRNALVACP